RAGRAEGPPPPIDGAGVVLVRLLGGRRAWPELDALAATCREAAVPLMCFGGEAGPDAELAARSTAPVSQAFEYLARGGLANIEHLLRFVADTVLYTGFGFDPPVEIPAAGVWNGWSSGVFVGQSPTNAPRVGVVFYRAHLIAGNTQFVADLCDGL